MKPKLQHLLNPCDIDRLPVLAPIGDLAAKLVTHCPCCNGFRIIFAFAAGFAIGVYL